MISRMNDVSYENEIIKMDKIFGSLPISYNGGKKPIFPWISRVLLRESAGHDSVLDGFSGTGIISSFFSMIGKETYSCDPLQTAYCMSVTLSQNDGRSLSDEEIDRICSHRVVDGIVFDEVVMEGLDDVAMRIRGFLTRNECAWMTRAREKMSSLHPLEQMIGHCAIRAICCLQPYGTPHGTETFRHRVKQKDSYGDKCLGHYMNSSYEIEADRWFRKYCDKFSKASDELSSMSSSRATCYRSDILAAMSKWGWLKEVDLAYFDPPYGRRQRGYASDYELSEAILGGNSIEFADFDTADGHSDNFDRLMDESGKIKKIIFSYDDKSWANISEIIDRVERHGRTVEIEQCSHIQGKTPNKKCKRDVMEYLIIARRKCRK